jgi:hypothetical protein
MHIADARRGERFMLVLQPSFGFAHPDCKLQLPLGNHIKTVLHCDIQLLTWYPKVRPHSRMHATFGGEHPAIIISLANRSMFPS